MRPFNILLMASTFLTPPVQPGIAVQHGRTANYDAGTGFDYVVDNAIGSDANDGLTLSTPFATITHAESVAPAGSVIAIRDKGLIYRDKITTSKALRFKGYGTERPKWYGSLNPSGFTRCTTGDEALLGAIYPNVFKVTVPIDLTGTDPNAIQHSAYHALLPTEADTLLNLVQRRRDESDPFEINATDTMFSVDAGDDITFGTTGTEGNGTGSTNTITHPSVLSAFTDEQLSQTTVMLLAYPNASKALKVQSALNSVLTLEPNTYFPDSTSGGSYALLNPLAYMTQGTWGYVVNADETALDFYVWPNSEANIDDIEIAARVNCLTISQTTGTQIDGIEFGRCSTDANAESCVIFDRCTNPVFIENKIFRYAHAEGGYGGLYIVSGSDGVIEKNDFIDAQAQFGYVISAGAYAAPTGYKIQFNHGYHLSQHFMRHFGITLCLIRFNLAENTGLGAHADKFVFYEGCSNNVFQGNIFIKTSGYGTTQENSSILIVCNIMPADYINGSDNGFRDQAHGSADGPIPNAISDFHNNLCPFDVNSDRAGPTVTLISMNTNSTPADPSDDVPYGTQYWDSHNNVWGGVDIGDGSRLATAGSNVSTTDTVIGEGDVVTTELDIFTDPSKSDFTTPPGSILTTKVGDDISARIAVYESLFPNDNLRVDINGDLWDPASPKVGPYVSYPVGTDLVAPVLSNLSATIDGANAAVAIDTNEAGGKIYWVRVASGSVAPTADQVIAGQDGTGAAGKSYGNQNVTATGTQSFSVSGTVGVTDDLYVVHRDRFLNKSNVLTTALAFASWTPTWRSFDGVQWLRHVGELTGAQAATKSSLIAFTVKRSAAQLTSSSGAVMLSPGDSVSIPAIVPVSTSKMRVKLESTSDVLIVDQFSPAMTADEEYLILVGFSSDSTNGAISRLRMIDIATGTVGSVADDVNPDDAITFLTNNMDLFSAPASYERMMVWDNATADVSQAATQQLFVAAGGGLQNPSVAVSSLGTPLIDISGPALSTGVNSGTGGDFPLS